MQGPTLTMSSALVFDSNSTFSRSHSSSNIPGLVKGEYVRPSKQRDDELPRSASFSSLPSLQNLQYHIVEELPKVQSADQLVLPPVEGHKSADTQERDGTTGSKDEQSRVERVGRRMSLSVRPKSWIQKVKRSPERLPSSEATNTALNGTPPVPPISKATRDKTKTVSESFATFARKSWITSSRSPSPSRNIAKDAENGSAKDGLTATSTISSSPRSSPNPASQLEKISPPKRSDSPSKSQSRVTSVLLKKKQRPQSVLMNFTSRNSANSSNSSLPRSSMDNRSTPRTSTDKIPLASNDSSIEKPRSLGIDLSRRNDELWPAFRSLDTDYSKFQSKTTALKTNVVRSTLLPFLRNHADHPSNKSLRPEDLDRRVMILNKWWNGILEMLDGRQNQTVSGTDRPILLEAVTGIMTRPEWRLAPSHFAPLSERSPEHHILPKEKSSNSLNSSASQFLVESVYHNTRNMFVQNLQSQMSLVVAKMSLRHAPASLVTFCGKATAYAFFFVPGIAEVLVRIWKLPTETIRRVADEFGLPRRLNKIENDELIALFPAHLHMLGWSSTKSLASQLRQKPNLPLGAANLAWYGPWVARWSGRDSDLFFVFTKYYHILAEEFMSSELHLVEKARAPGFVLVHAQILATLDSTIHRQPAAEPLPLTFDDVLAGADASTAALPLPSSNAARLMAENRLIMLLRDFLSERASDFKLARMTFAEAFSKMMQATARRTSLFDHSACFVLCDFMEEALALFVRFQVSQASESDFIDWHFWLDVCRKMLESENSMSEIRLFAFIFGVWSVVTNCERRKELLCLEWLLTENTFDKFFNHWCPMVRAYYMRLLCWRLCREDGEASDLDTKIFSMVSYRLKSNWAHHLYLRQAAEISHKLPPSTIPCLPAPGRRLLIIRNDTQAPSTNLFLGFDGILPASSSTQSTSSKRRSSLTALATLSKLETSYSTPKLIADSPSNTAASKKKWSLIGKMLPSSFITDPSSISASPSNPIKSKTLEEARKETAAARSRPIPNSNNSSPGSDSTHSTPSYRAFCFKFSLEWSSHLNTSPAQNGNGRNGYGDGRERRTIPPRLPAPAQAWIGAKIPGISTEVGPRNPEEGDMGREKAARAKYAGRALAEWTLIVAECNNFVERRRAEGVPSLRLIEVPTLGVEGFRRLG